MKRSEIIKIQERIDVIGDGFWGPKSIIACQNHLKNLMPSPHLFPVEGSEEFDEFYGPHGDDNYTPPTRRIGLPFTIYYNLIPIKSLKVHKKCADSLLRVFERLAEVYPNKTLRESAGILEYNGLYNPRIKRGSLNSWSMHSWAIAIDINANKNGNRVSWPVNATMSIEVMECFAKEGWLSAGAFWGRDAMHFQATAPL